MDDNDLWEVNEIVNQLPYQSDAHRYGQADFWERADGKGNDCEDYALGKLHRLLERGWPVEKLRLACCYVETGDYHAVLEVEGLVLDNRYTFPMLFFELAGKGYRPDRIQRVGGSREWTDWKWI